MFNISKHLRLPSLYRSDPAKQDAHFDENEYVSGLRKLMHGFDLMLNDDVSGTKETFNSDTVESCIGKAGNAFYHAILGLEPTAIEEAWNCLNTAEQRAEARRKFMEIHDLRVGSYPGGYEYQLCVCDLSLMQSILGFVAGSLFDNVKSAYHLRKTFLSFTKMMEHVREVQQKKETGEIQVTNSNAQFIDEFIESGISTGYGVLTFLISLLSPSVMRVLSFFSMHGERKDAVQLLWKATTYSNMQGAIALLCLYAFNALVQSSASIVPLDYADELRRCQDGIDNVRQRYSNGAIWAVMQGKLHYLRGDPEKALELEKTRVDTSMEQIIAMKGFDTAMLFVGIRKFKEAAQAILDLEDLNSWSHSFYRFFAGCCMLQHSRELKNNGGNIEESENYLAKAIEYLKQSPTLVQKKKRRVLPVEMYLVRKVQKWEDRAAKLKVNLADAMDIPPYIELIYIFVTWCLNDPEHLLILRSELERCQCTEDDGVALQEFLLAVVERHLKNYESSRARLIRVMNMNKDYLSQANRDFWILPSAHYEMAALEWDMHALEAEREVKQQLKKAQEYHNYDLEGRLSMLTQAALQTVQSEKP
ncbi:protein with a role in clearing aggregate protein [Schizosaccharomyces osmophilus]|uniref:Protein with a role in clearing aggregate protein n=1 Tax=Schizosaccharomyces osmophilus TaxID=2545709 RepID=A0AAF0AVL0_9SCHI|nr:protein with a role in clearing aggregate protein [Schizosaccharomyces osmophilus]WBW73681.1 protein with a role in clearing aggregate protein [Schizosaccharomyces osmophilus]